MLKKCQKIWGGRANLNLVNCAAEDLPFIDQSFDVVLHVGGINFFSDKKTRDRRNDSGGQAPARKL